MGDLSIKLLIAGRTYPLTIKKDEEETVRKASRLVNERLKEFEENYTVRDKQDLLAMCSLHFATQHINENNLLNSIEQSAKKEITDLNQYISQYLQSKEA